MNIEVTKIELAKLILSIDNPDLIERLAQILQSETSDFWHSLTPDQQADIHKAIEELDRGERVDWETFRKKVS